MFSAEPNDFVPSTAEVHDLERQLHALQKAQQRSARHRARLSSRMAALEKDTTTRDDTSPAAATSAHVPQTPGMLVPMSTMSTHASPTQIAVESVRSHTAQLVHRAVLTSLTLEITQLWQSLVLPWWHNTVLPFEAHVQKRLAEMSVRLSRCACRLEPSRPQYRWRRAGSAPLPRPITCFNVASWPRADEEDEDAPPPPPPCETQKPNSETVVRTPRGEPSSCPVALRWYTASAHASSAHTCLSREAPRNDPEAHMSTVEGIRQQLEACVRTFSAAVALSADESVQEAEGDERALWRCPRSLGHVLRVWDHILPHTPPSQTVPPSPSPFSSILQSRLTERLRAGFTDTSLTPCTECVPGQGHTQAIATVAMSASGPREPGAHVVTNEDEEAVIVNHTRASLHDLRWLLCDDQMAAEYVTDFNLKTHHNTSGQCDAMETASPHESSEAMYGAKLLSACCEWWLPVAEARLAVVEEDDAAPSHLPLNRLPPSLAALHTASTGLTATLDALIMTTDYPLPTQDPLVSSVPFTPATWRAQRLTAEAFLRAPCATEGGAVDSYQACTCLVHAALDARGSDRRHNRLRRQLAAARDFEARHRRHRQESEARWEEARSTAAELARAVVPRTIAALASPQDCRRVEEMASVCPLQLLLSPASMADVSSTR